MACSGAYHKASADSSIRKYRKSAIRTIKEMAYGLITIKAERKVIGLPIKMVSWQRSERHRCVASFHAIFKEVRRDRG